MNEDKMLELLEKVTSVCSKVDTMQRTMDNIDSRLTNLENIKQNDTEQNLKIEQLRKDVDHGSNKMKDMEARIQALENADGEKAKNAWKTIWNYVLVALASALISNIGTIIQWLQK